MKLSAMVVVAVVAVGCAKTEPGEPQLPVAVADVPRPSGVPVPVDAEGWPVGWPSAGVVLVRRDGTEGTYYPGRVIDRSHAERWGGLTPERMQMLDQAADKASEGETYSADAYAP